MQTTQQLFQVFVQRDQQLRPSRWFSRESLAKRYCEEFNVQIEPGASPREMAETSPNPESPASGGRAVAIYQVVEIPLSRPAANRQPAFPQLPK